VAVLVVDRLEVVDVDQAQRQRGALALGALGLTRQFVAQVAAVVEAGELVACGQALDAFQRLLQVRRLLLQALAQGAELAGQQRQRGQHRGHDGEVQALHDGVEAQRVPVAPASVGLTQAVAGAPQAPGAALRKRSRTAAKASRYCG
jgi:hypothetical protein